MFLNPTRPIALQNGQKNFQKVFGNVVLPSIWVIKHKLTGSALTTYKLLLPYTPIASYPLVNHAWKIIPLQMLSGIKVVLFTLELPTYMKTWFSMVIQRFYLLNLPFQTIQLHHFVSSQIRMMLNFNRSFSKPFLS